MLLVAKAAPTDAWNACSYNSIINNMRSMQRAPSCREHIAVPAFKRYCLRTANGIKHSKGMHNEFLFSQYIYASIPCYGEAF